MSVRKLYVYKKKQMQCKWSVGACKLLELSCEARYDIDHSLQTKELIHSLAYVCMNVIYLFLY